VSTAPLEVAIEELHITDIRLVHIALPFVVIGSLWKHLRTHAHSGEKPYGCHICTMAFTKKDHLTRHLRAQPGEKPYGCHICTGIY